MARYARAGVITPDHVIRTKPWPLIVPAPEAGKLDDFKKAVHQARALTRRTTRLFLTPEGTRQRTQCTIPCPALYWCRALASSGSA